MTAALVLVDLQQDFLALPGLQPAPGQILERTAQLLSAFRRRGLPVAHVLTTVTRHPDNRMPHWKTQNTPENGPDGRWMCEQNTPGHSPPPLLKALPTEAVIDKQFFSGFDNPSLLAFLQTHRCDTVILAGIHLHACVRAAALDAYRHGFHVLVAQDAVASDDPVHAAITHRYLADRSIGFAPVDHLLTLLEKPSRATPDATHPEATHFEHHSPTDSRTLLWQHPVTSPAEISARARDLRHAWILRPATTVSQRAQKLRDLADRLTDHQNDLASHISRDVGKPITMAHAEVRRSVQLLHAIADHAAGLAEGISPSGARYRYLPLGVVGIITPWNNPLAIPVGKIAAALVYDNAVVWKPAPPATQIAQRLLALWKTSDPAAHIEIVAGAHRAATLVAQDPSVDALSLSGSLAAGYALHEIAARRHLPYQAELGGNNAAIIAPDADLSHADQEIAAGAFGFAGQRCTANRRAIVVGDEARALDFVAGVVGCASQMHWGDPADPRTVIGPVISRTKRDQLAALLSRCRDSGLKTFSFDVLLTELLERGAFAPPAIVLATDPHHEIVQEESFGPILVIQVAPTFDHALTLCNGVRQGLAAALFSHDPALQAQFLAHAQAGILKLNTSTSDADACSPFGGWKASGIGPAEHGPADREFFTRVQTLYGL